VGQDNTVRSIIIPSLFVHLTNVTSHQIKKDEALAQTGDMRIVYKILGRELKERPRCKWEDSTKMSL
jgi:hypothetical protein